MEKFYDKYRDSAFEGIINNNGITVLSDGMRGEYVILGHVIAKTENHQHFDKPLKMSTDKKTKTMVSGLINMALGEEDLVNTEEIDLWVVSHYR